MDLERATAEFVRVLRPGGGAVMIELRLQVPQHGCIAGLADYLREGNFGFQRAAWIDDMYIAHVFDHAFRVRGRRQKAVLDNRFL